MVEIEEYWMINNDFFDVKKEDSLIDLYKRIVLEMQDLGGCDILDYGCGAGLLEYHTRNIYKPNFYLHDINKQILKKAADFLGEYHKVYIYNPEEKRKFHGIIFCLVDVCIKNNQSLIDTYEEIFKLLKKGGKLCIGTTHPCFRDESFHGFETSFTRKEQRFEYFTESLPFKLYYGVDSRSIQFIDHHRSLSFTLNTLLKIGFTLYSIKEIKDTGVSIDSFHSQKSPFILFTLKK